MMRLVPSVSFWDLHCSSAYVNESREMVGPSFYSVSFFSMSHTSASSNDCAQDQELWNDHGYLRCEKGKGQRI